MFRKIKATVTCLSHSAQQLVSFSSICLTSPSSLLGSIPPMGFPGIRPLTLWSGHKQGQADTSESGHVNSPPLCLSPGRILTFTMEWVGLGHQCRSWLRSVNTFTRSPHISAWFHKYFIKSQTFILISQAKRNGPHTNADGSGWGLTFMRWKPCFKPCHLLSLRHQKQSLEIRPAKPSLRWPLQRTGSVSEGQAFFPRKFRRDAIITSSSLCMWQTSSKGSQIPLGTTCDDRVKMRKTLLSEILTGGHSQRHLSSVQPWPKKYVNHS